MWQQASELHGTAGCGSRAAHHHKLQRPVATRRARIHRRALTPNGNEAISGTAAAADSTSCSTSSGRRGACLSLLAAAAAAAWPAAAPRAALAAAEGVAAVEEQAYAAYAERR